MAHLLLVRFLQYLLIASLVVSSTAALLASQGQTIVIPSWKVQSSSKAGNDVSKLSDPSLDTGPWYTTRSKATLMATLLENKVYNESDIFFSTNLQRVGYEQFQVPWFYRSDINVQKVGNGSFFQLKTNGISSRADVYLNGELVADNNTQAGSYVGLTYDITAKIKAGRNILLVRAHPTDYNKDLALGFVDWNPYPPDNGTGIWRDVEVTQTGPVTISSPRIHTTLGGEITIFTDVQSLSTTNVQGEVACRIHDPTEQEVGNQRAGFTFSGKGSQKITLSLKVGDPQIWWPRHWGQQPLYTVQCNATTGGGLSDQTAKTRFGIRNVTSKLNEHDDTVYFVNGVGFQILGAGYTSDMFLRFDLRKLRAQFEYVLDMGMNTVRLEGKQEHKELYDLADELGLMIMAGWECCDKWEGWTYNDEGSGVTWTDPDYFIANHSMRHEAELMQPHPSMLTFLVGSDFWPDDRATAMYVEALEAYDWNTPIIASASQRGFPQQLGNGGMKMEGPYDWVPPNYWYDPELRLGSAFSFGSELGAGVGTPELNSLRKFLSEADQEDLWKNPDKGLYHMSTSVSSFYTRKIYNDALWARYGAPSSLNDYLLKAQMADYEATRAQFEAFTSRWNASRPATGLIYWMLNNAWPSLHWNLFDYYLHPGGSYFGVKTSSANLEQVIYDYENKSVYLVDRRVEPTLWDLLDRTVDIELIGQDGKLITKRSVDTTTEPNTSKRVVEVPGLEEIKQGQVAFLKLELWNYRDRKRLSRNVYWISPKTDALQWGESTWYFTPVSSYADYQGLNNMTKAEVSVSAGRSGGVGKLVLENKSKVPAVFVRLNLVYTADGKDVLPVRWSDNYVTLWPLEKMELNATYEAGLGAVRVEISGKNVESRTVDLG